MPAWLVGICWALVGYWIKLNSLLLYSMLSRSLLPFWLSVKKKFFLVAKSELQICQRPLTGRKCGPRNVAEGWFQRCGKNGDYSGLCYEKRT
jgi:hypothetical protein